MHRLSLTISLPDDGQDSEEMENVLRAKLQQPLHVAELVVQGCFVSFLFKKKSSHHHLQKHNSTRADRQCS